MTLRRLLGLEPEPEDGGINVAMSNVTMPLDLALEMIIRQQGQLFTMLNGLQGQVHVGAQIAINMDEKITHLHNDLVELQGSLASAAKHPVERVDEQTELRESKPEREKVH